MEKTFAGGSGMETKPASTAGPGSEKLNGRWVGRKPIIAEKQLASRATGGAG
jgi:hypothetical protein